MFHGLPWSSMVFRGIPWSSMVFRGILCGFYVVLCGFCATDTSSSVNPISIPKYSPSNPRSSAARAFGCWPTFCACQIILVSHDNCVERTLPAACTWHAMMNSWAAYWKGPVNSICRVQTKNISTKRQGRMHINCVKNHSHNFTVKFLFVQINWTLDFFTIFSKNLFSHNFFKKLFFHNFFSKNFSSQFFVKTLSKLDFLTEVWREARQKNSLCIDENFLLISMNWTTGSASPKLSIKRESNVVLIQNGL